MSILEYLEAVKERLLTDSLVVRFEILRERATQVDGHLRARLIFYDNSALEFSEYVQLSPDGAIEAITYSYHWCTSSGDLICRWDNTPHFPKLEGFPHHLHIAASNAVLPGQPVNIFNILDEIARQIK